MGARTIAAPPGISKRYKDQNIAVFFLFFLKESAHYLTISIDDARDPVLHTAPQVSVFVLLYY